MFLRISQNNEGYLIDSQLLLFCQGESALFQSSGDSSLHQSSLRSQKSLRHQMQREEDHARARARRLRTRTLQNYKAELQVTFLPVIYSIIEGVPMTLSSIFRLSQHTRKKCSIYICLRPCTATSCCDDSISVFWSAHFHPL